MAGKLGSDVIRGRASMEGGCRDILSVGQRVRFVGVCGGGRAGGWGKNKTCFLSKYSLKTLDNGMG